MSKWFKSFWKDEEGLGTLEMLLIAAVLVGIALMFRKKILAWVNEILNGENGIDTKIKDGTKVPE
jgi:hypothetical protein